MASQTRSVQFTSIPPVLEYYQGEELPQWRIAPNRGNDIFTYDGDDLQEGIEKLEKNLKQIKDEGSAAIYVLTITDGNKEQSAGIRFREYSENYVPGLVGGAMVGNEIISMLRAQEKKIQELSTKIDELEGEDETEPQSNDDALGAIARLLENPFVTGFLSKVLDGSAKPKQAIAGVPGVESENLTEDQKIETALRILRQHDERLGDHLIKLARIASNSPAKFKNLIGLLSLY